MKQVKEFMIHGLDCLELGYNGQVDFFGTTYELYVMKIDGNEAKIKLIEYIPPKNISEAFKRLGQDLLQLRDSLHEVGERAFLYATGNS